MYILAPFIFGVLLAILLIFSSCLVKIFAKVESFTGFCSGVCCSFLFSVIASVYIGVVLFLVMDKVAGVAKSSAQNPGQMAPQNVLDLANYTKGALLVLWCFFFVLFLIEYALIFLFTKRISKPENEYNSVLMFASGFVFLPSIFFFLYWFILIGGINAIISKAIESGQSEETAAAQYVNLYGSAFFTLIEFVFFFAMLSISGVIIMITLHHRKLNSFVIWISLACFFGPSILLLLFLLTLKVAFIEYPMGLPTLASFGLGVFFYLKYSDESNRGEALNQQNYELTN